MKIGIIYTAFNSEHYIADSLQAWIEARSNKLGGHEFYIAAICAPFDKFGQSRMDDTHGKLIELVSNEKIDIVHSETHPVKETVARGWGLTSAFAYGVDIVWQVDSDEFYTIDEISKIIRYVERQSFIPAFRLCLKNFVFDQDTYLAEPFNPMRIHRTKFNSCVITKFWDDNNIMYDNDGVEVRDIQLANLTIPKTVAWVKHLTWLSDFRSKHKVEYQTARGWQCSFKWNYELARLEFNTEYYRSRGLALPEIVKIPA